MQKQEPDSTESRQLALSPAGRDRLVDLLSVALERFIRVRPAPLTSFEDLCLYDRRADDDEANDE